jgi:hypothetical protein
MEDREILLALGRLEGKVDALIAASKVHSENLTAHDQRIRALESSKSLMLGACSLLGAATSWVVTYLAR